MLLKTFSFFADKTSNVYETTPEVYNKLLAENITKTYKIGNVNMTDNINEEFRNITDHYSIGNRIDIMAQRNAYITVKDH